LTESDDLTQGSEERTATVLMILHRVADQQIGAMTDARDQLLAALGQLGYSCGPVVGDICAVTGSPDHIAALHDHVGVMHQTNPVEGANEELLAMLRPVVDQLVFDDPVEPFPDQLRDPSADITPTLRERDNPHDDGHHPTRGESPSDEPPA